MWRDEVPSGGALHWVRRQYRDTGREQGVTGWRWSLPTTLADYFNRPDMSAIPRTRIGMCNERA